MQVQKAWGEMLHAGCSAMSWSTENHRHLWGRNFDFNRIAKGSGITYLPKGTRYSTCTAKAQRGMPSQVHQRAAYAAVGTGLLALSSGPVLYEGINEKGLMGGQLYYRTFARYAPAVRQGTLPLQPPFVVYHLLAQCASVAEAAETMQQEVTVIDAPVLGTVPPLHWSFSDCTGETAVIEPDADGLHIYRNTMGVMTNSPGYPWHRLHLLNYANVRDLDYDAFSLNGEVLEQCFSGSGAQGLPGDWSAPSRFVRLAFLKHYAQKGADEAAGVARMLRLFQSAAFPLGMVRVSQSGPATALDTEITPYDYTVYTAVMCAESRRFYWATYENQRVQYVDLQHLQRCPRPAQIAFQTAPDFCCRNAAFAEEGS